MLQQNTTKRLGYWLALLHQLFDAATEKALAGERLTRREWQVLHAIHIGNTAVSDVDQALAPLLVEDGALSYRAIVERFDERGWAALSGDAINLTEAGSAAHSRADVLVNAYAADALNGISEEEFLVANDVLRRIARNLDPENPALL